MTSTVNHITAAYNNEYNFIFIDCWCKDLVGLFIKKNNFRFKKQEMLF